MVQKQLMTSAMLQWQVGEWQKLSQISYDDLRTEHERARVAMMVATAWLQLGERSKAKEALTWAQEFGATKEQIAEQIVSSVYNTLGRVQAINGNMGKAYEHFSHAINYSSLESDQEIATQLRMIEQLAQLDIAQNWKRLKSSKKVLDAEIFSEVLPRSKQYLEIQDLNNIHFLGDLSIQFWINIQSWPNKWTDIISKFESDILNEFCFRLKNADNGQWYYGSGTNGVSPVKWIPKEYLALNEWVHIALVRKLGEYSRIYIDGIIRNERDFNGVVQAALTNSSIKLMGCPEKNSFLKGMIAEVSIEPFAKTSAEIHRDMSSDHTSNKESMICLFFSNIEKQDTDRQDSVPRQIKKNKSAIASAVRSLDYHALLKKLASDKLISIVVVGANDGKNNDPIYSFVRNNPNSNMILLVEPQSVLIPYLTENYNFHPKKKIANYAIGKENQLILYTVKKEYWAYLDVPYAKERKWPIYRAPAGIASSNRNHVKEWLTRYLKTENISDAIEKSVIQSKNLINVLNEFDICDEIDVLQIDTEGFDDEIIYASDIHITKPKLIHFESIHLDKEKKSNLFNYLKTLNYDVFEIAENTMALHNSIDWSFDE